MTVTKGSPGMNDLLMAKVSELLTITGNRIIYPPSRYENTVSSE